MRSGCSNSLIAADGLLNVPNFAVGCVCNYPLQTSFALVPSAILAFMSVVLLALWFFFIGRREHPWKRWVLAAMVIGLAAIGISVRGDLFWVLAPGALFSSVVWLVSGTATLLSYGGRSL